MRFKRILLSLTVAAVMFAMLSSSVFATDDVSNIIGAETQSVSSGDELLSGYQKEIDRILIEYLGTTNMPVEEIETFVEQMEWEIYQSARWEISVLEEQIYGAMTNGEMPEILVQQLVADNPVFFAFASALEEKNAHDNYISTLAELQPLTNVKVVASGRVSGTSTKVTVTTTGGFYSATTGTATVTNSTTQKLTFTYSFKSGSDWMVGTDSVSSGGTKELMPGESIILSHKTGSGIYESAYIYLENLTLSDVASVSNVTVYFDSGTASVAGVSISNGATVQIASTGATVTATDSNFVAWINKDTNQIISKEASFTYKPDSDASIKAIHGPTARFYLGNDYLYETLTTAISAASSTTAPSKTIILANTGTLPAGDYTIPSDVTLLIPYNAEHTLCTTEPSVVENIAGHIKPSAFRTLTMSEGANIIVEGNMSLSGTVNTYQAGGYNAVPYGPQGYVNMKTGSKITVESDGNLYVWGYIYGDGTVLIKDGATVYEDFQVRDYRGGDATTAMKIEKDWFGNWSDNYTYRVFPMNQYYMQNVEVPMTLESGATEKGFFAVYVTLAGVQTEHIPFIGENSMFQMASGSSITKWYDDATDRLIVDVEGNLSVSQYSISIQIQTIGSITIDSAQHVLPITNNLTINIVSGSTLTVNQDLALLPGAEINIEEGAICTLGEGVELFVYDADEWTATVPEGSSAYGGVGTTIGFCGEYNSVTKPLKYVAAKNGTPVSRALSDATVLINGTVDASKGYVYTTKSGANICSSKTGVAILKPDTETTETYQVWAAGSDRTSVEYVPIAVTPAKLKNEADDSYLLSAENTDVTTYNYDHHYCCGDAATHGVWYAGDHTYTLDGNGEVKCACGGHPSAMILPNSGNSTYYSSLAAACKVFDTTSHSHIQMLTATTEPSIDTTDTSGNKKDIYLDLNGKTVKLDDDGTTGKLAATLYGMDSYTIGYDATDAGSLIADVTTTQPTATLELTGITPKHYLAINDSDTKTTTFHRVAVSLTRYAVAKPNIIVEGIFRSTSKAYKKLSDMGFAFTPEIQVGEEQKSAVWYDKTPGTIADDELKAKYPTGAFTMIQYSYQGTDNTVTPKMKLTTISGTTKELSGTSRNVKLDFQAVLDAQNKEAG